MFLCDFLLLKFKKSGSTKGFFCSGFFKLSDLVASQLKFAFF